jgi:cytochrome c553
MTDDKPRRSRDNFRQKTINTLAKRVAYRCSNPACRIPTIGPEQRGDGTVVVGVAAHITAAAKGGPRYDPSLTPEQRRHQSNGIWLYEIHGKQVDADEQHFTVETLRAWKKVAESEVADAITCLQVPRPPKVVSAPDAEDVEFGQSLGLPPEDTVEAVTARILEAARADLEAFKGMPGWPQHPIVLDLTLVEHSNARLFDVARLALAMETFNEIALIAPPGTGKTTTIIQLTDSLLANEKLPAVYIPLSEWASQGNTFLASLLSRRAFQNVRQQHFMLLAEYGRLALILDGWNELDNQSRKRAANDIKALQRDFPEIRIVVSTRQQALDVPLSGPVIRIQGLSESKQAALARALRGADGGMVLDHAWRTPGLRELVVIPLYLTSLVSRASGGTLPTTKEEVLRMFVKEHEQVGPRAEALREKLFGLHKEFLAALAGDATSAGSTTLSESRARAAVKRAEDRLSEEGQLAASHQPSAVLDVLVDFHMLVRSGAGSGTISFQHQQFQEWYASFEVEALMRARFAGNAASGKCLREDVLNIPAWEEAILFACERSSRADAESAKAVAATILETMEIDPLLAAEMIYRSAGGVWDEIGPSIVAFVEKWHAPGQVDRAVHFMIGSGRSEFARGVWRLISDPDTQVHLSALRAGRRFRPSVLGADAEKRLAALPEEVRKHVLSEIAGQSGMDGIELATKLACADASATVKTAVIESLQFRRADRFVAEILHSAPDQVWDELAGKGYADEVGDPKAAERLRTEQQRAFEREASPMQKLRMLTHGDGPSIDSAGREFAFLIESGDFAVRDQNASWAVQEAFQRYPDETSSALIHRLEAGMEIPFRSEDLLRAKGYALDDGPLVAAVFKPVERDRVAAAAANVIGPKTIGNLIDRLMEIEEKARSAGKWDDALRTEYHTLFGRISSTGLNAFVDAILSRSDTKDPGKIGLLAEIFARHGRDDSDNALRLSGERHVQMMLAVEQWADALLSSAESTRSQLANVARAIERLSDPKLVLTLQCLLAEDLARWKQSREELLAAHHAGRRIDSDSHMSWTLQYRRAFSAIGGTEVEKLMREYLPDAGFCGFGVTAAWVLKDLWDREQNSSRDKTLLIRSDFVDVNAQRARRQKGGIESSPRADAILSVVNELVKPDAGEEVDRHAIALASVALLMPCAGKEALIDSLLQLPGPWAWKQGLLKVLVIAGETISADMIVAGINELLEEARTTGQGFRGAFPMPRLAGQQPEYLENQLRAFNERRRTNPIMFNVAHVLNPQMITALAAHFKDLDAKPLGGAPKELVAAGKTLYEEGVPDANVPPCSSCHGPESKGDGAFPRLAGQLHDYIFRKLVNWNKERGQDRSKPDTSAIMEPIAHSLKEPQIEAVAAYVSYLE